MQLEAANLQGGGYASLNLVAIIYIFTLMHHAYSLHFTRLSGENNQQWPLLSPMMGTFSNKLAFAKIT